MSTKCHEEYLRKAIELSRENVKKGGGPFGAVIVDEAGKIIGSGTNRVTANSDPTAHAEIMAIRAAAAAKKHFSLANCTIYTSCEPCPMCLAAIYWARLKAVFFGNTKADAALIDFSDQFIYDELALPVESRQIPQAQLLHDEAILAFNDWEAKGDKTPY